MTEAVRTAGGRADLYLHGAKNKQCAGSVKFFHVATDISQ